MVVRNWDEIKVSIERELTFEDGQEIMKAVAPVYGVFNRKVISKERDEFYSFLMTEAFVYLLRYDPSKSEHSLNKFLFNNLYNRAKNFLRDSYRDNQKSFCYSPESDAETSGVDADKADHFSRLLRVEMDTSENIIEEIISTLDERCKQTVQMMLDGYALNEIEKITGKSRTYVRRSVDLVIFKLEEYGLDMNHYQKYHDFKKRTERLGTTANK